MNSVVHHAIIGLILVHATAGGICMARPKKNGTYLNVCVEKQIYDRLVKFCEDAGQTKTVAVERALTAYLDSYERMQKKLKELQTTNNS